MLGKSVNDKFYIVLDYETDVVLNPVLSSGIEPALYGALRGTFPRILSPALGPALDRALDAALTLPRAAALVQLQREIKNVR